MSFVARIGSDLVVVDAGSTAPLTVEIVHRGDSQERFELQVEGLDPDWTAIPIPTFSVEPGETHSEKILFRPVRASESTAGNYPFVVHVRSLESGEVRSAQGMLQIKPFHHLSMEISPKKGHYSPLRKHNVFDITLINLGNSEHTLQLTGNDPEDGCAFDFEEDSIVLGPGHQRTLALTVEPKRQKLISSSSLFGFTVAARSREISSVMAGAQGQLEQRPLLTFTTLFTLVLMLAIAAVWVMLIPKPPSFWLEVDKKQLIAGEPLEIRWKSTNATEVTLMYAGHTVTLGTQTSGSRTFVPTEPGVLTVTGYASRDDKRSAQETISVMVEKPAPIPDPKITRFAVTPRQVAVGEKVTIQYQFNPEVTEAYLSPTQDRLLLELDKLEVTITQPGTTRFSIVAKNRQGVSVRSQEVSVSAKQVSKAVIVSFDAIPTRLIAPDNLVQLRWQTTDAVYVALVIDGQTVQVDPNGEREIAVSKTSSVKLIVRDGQALETSKEVRITVENPEPPVPDGGSTDPPTSTPKTGGT
jgi:hypothetical protein